MVGSEPNEWYISRWLRYQVALAMENLIQINFKLFTKV